MTTQLVPSPARAGHTHAAAYTVVIVTGSHADATDALLQGLVQCTDDDMYAVTIVDRQQSPLTSRLLATLGGDVDIICVDDSVSWATACNMAAFQTRGERLVFLDSDATVFPGWLRMIDEMFAANPFLSVVRSIDAGAMATTMQAFAGMRGFHDESLPGHEIDDLCTRAGILGHRMAFDRNRVDGRSTLRTQFLRDGYVKLESFVDPDTCDRIVSEGNRYYESQGVDPYSLNRVMNVHNASRAALDHLTGERFFAVLRELFAEDPLFLQTILFFEGSQQPLHSDWIYMSTDRHHRLMGTWLALEDVYDDAGPLRYLPGSHVLPVESISERWARLAPEVEAKLARGEMPPPQWLAGGPSGRYGYLYDGWEDSIAPMAEAAGFRPQRFLAKKGDVLLWHANLIHGGSPIERAGATRKSIVAHYMTREIGGYYDISYPDRMAGFTVAQVEYNAANVVPDLKPKQ